MGNPLDYAPIAAAAFAIPQFLPQLHKLQRTDDTAGVSWPWAALTSVNNAAWFAYFALSGYWAALVPASSASLLAGALATMLARRGQATARPAVLVGAWGALLGRAAGRARRRRRPRRPGNAAYRRLRPAGHPVDLDRLPDRSPHRDLPGNLAAHPRRAVGLGDLRPAQVGSAPGLPG